MATHLTGHIYERSESYIRNHATRPIRIVVFGLGEYLCENTRSILCVSVKWAGVCLKQEAAKQLESRAVAREHRARLSIRASPPPPHAEARCRRGGVTRVSAASGSAVAKPRGRPALGRVPRSLAAHPLFPWPQEPEEMGASTLGQFCRHTPLGAHAQ